MQIITNSANGQTIETPFIIADFSRGDRNALPSILDYIVNFTINSGSLFGVAHALHEEIDDPSEYLHEVMQEAFDEIANHINQRSQGRAELTKRPDQGVWVIDEIE